MTNYYWINASELNYNMISEYIRSSNMDILSCCIVLVVEFIIIMMNLFTLRWIQ